jgi:tRNA nucleotidyltransferase (CCA-adding enzyme)
MGRNISDLLGKSLDGSRLELLHLLAYQASMLRMPLYLVGGMVRDVLLGRAVKDFDLVVEGDGTALAELVLKKYGGRIMIHPWFGTATWAVNESTFKRLEVPLFDLPEVDMSFDMITARSETYAQPGALPTVKFSNIDDDLRRRDFTINAMAVRLDGGFFGDLFDPLHGQKDLENKSLRVLHERSFVDDPTRMLRAVRYAERYGFEIEQGTLKLVNDEARGILSQLSGERVRHELDLIFDEEHAVDVLGRLKDLDLLRFVHPALQNADHERLSGLVDTPPEGFGKFIVSDIFSFRQSLGWVLYLMNLSLIDLEEIEVRLTFPALLARAVREASSLLVDIPSFKKWKPSQWTFRLDDVHPLAVYAVSLVTSESALREYLTKWRTVRPVTTGDDLKARGLEPGPKFKEILTRLRAARLDGEVGTEEEEEMMLKGLLR